MTSPRLRPASFGGDSIRTQCTLLLFGSGASRRWRALSSRVAIRRSGCKRACSAASANRGRRQREGVEGVEGIEGVEGENPSIATLDSLDAVAPFDPLGPRRRPRRVARPPSTHRPSPRQANNRRPRLPRSVRFPRGFRARQRRGSIDDASPRSLRDVFGHTASISRRRTS